MAKSQLNPSIMSHEHIQSQGHYKLNVRKADYKLLYYEKADTLQTVVVSESGHYKILYSQKADTRKYCNEKVRHYKVFYVVYVPLL